MRKPQNRHKATKHFGEIHVVFVHALKPPLCIFNKSSSVTTLEHSEPFLLEDHVRIVA